MAQVSEKPSDAPPDLPASASEVTREESMALLYPNAKSFPSGRVPAGVIAAWVVPYFGFYASKYFKQSWMKTFFIDDYPQASLGFVALFSTIKVLVDAFTDPWMANKTDACQDPSGRRKPFFKIGALVTLLVFTFAWTPPWSLSQPVGNKASVAASVWYGVFHVGFALMETVVTLPVDGLGGDLTYSSVERNRIFYHRGVWVMLGIMVGVLVPAFVPSTCTGTSGDEVEGCPTYKEIVVTHDGCTTFPVLAAVFSVITAVGLWNLGRTVKERDPRTCTEAQHMPVVPSLVQVSMNRPFRILLMADIVEAIAQNTPFVVMPFVTRYVVLPPGSEARCGEDVMIADPDTLFGMFGVVYFLGNFAAMPLWRCVMSRFGKRRAFILRNVAVCVSTLVLIGPLLQEGAVVSCCVFAFFWGMGNGGGDWMLRSIVADVVDYDEFLTGTRREAQYFMGIEFLPKFVEIPSEAAPLLLMAWCGYERNVAQNSAVVWILRLFFSLIPAAVIALGTCMLYYFPMKTEEQHAALLEGIQLHRQGQPAKDPYYGGQIEVAALPTDNAAHIELLSHFYGSELKLIVNSGCETLRRTLLTRLMIGGCLVAPVGALLLALGMPALLDGEDASVAPLGSFLLGVTVLVLWFEGVRYLRLGELRSKQESGEIGMPILEGSLAYWSRFTYSPKDGD